jgi:hypothetical protein
MGKFFSFFLIVLFSSIVAIYIYTQTSKPKIQGAMDRLPCHKNITCFEKGYDEDGIEKAKELIKNGNYRILSSIDKAQYMESTLFSFVSVEDMDTFFYNYIQQQIDKPLEYDNGAIIKYTIFENDIEDPKKKSDNCKLYRGYIVFKVLSPNNKLVYQNQVDFMDHEGKDVSKTLQCSFESFLTFK